MANTNITFTVSTDKVRKAADQVSNQMETLEDTAKALVAAIEALKGAKWTGNAQTKVQSKCTDFKKGIRTMKNRLNEEVTELKDVASKYETTESTNVNTANNNLDGNVVK